MTLSSLEGLYLSQGAYSFRCIEGGEKEPRGKISERMRRWWRNWPIAHTWVVTRADTCSFGLVGGVTGTGCHNNQAVAIATWLERMAASSATATR